MRVCKLPRFMDGSIGPIMEIFEISGLPIHMVPHFHKRNVYIKRKLQLRRNQKCIALVRGKPPPTCAGLQTTPGSIGPRMEICENSGLTNPFVPHLHQKNGYIKRMLRVWRAVKCDALISAETVLTIARPQTTLFHGEQYRV